jgi:hypothetical protein
MPRRKKHASELTTDEAMKRLFPKKVREEAKLPLKNPAKRRNLSLITVV